jgi:outer membrane protein assembly factor BamB
MRFRVLFPILAVLTMPVAALAADGSDWPMWRGPRGDGQSSESGIPVKWSGTDHIAWKTRLPGKGHSSPIVWGDRVFVTSAVEDKNERLLLCLDRKDGQVIWQRTVVTSELEHKNTLNSYASSTPATDGKLVYVPFYQQPKVQLVAYDFDGKEVWRAAPGEFHSTHGFCSSPILYKDLVILNCDQDAPLTLDAYLVAYEKATGKERWRTIRPNRTRSYCAPIITNLAGKTQMVLSGSKCTASYDPDTGKQIWIMDGPTEQMVASLVETQGILFCTGGYPDHHIIAIDPSGTGEVTRTHILWRDGGKTGEQKAVSYVPSPIANDQWFFIVSDRGLASCYEAKTGKVMWRQQLGRHHSASAVSANGNLIYFTSDAGETFVLKAGPTYELVAKNELGEEVRASPGISRGEIFIRGVENLYCIK